MKTLIATALVALSLAAAVTPAAAFDANTFVRTMGPSY